MKKHLKLAALLVAAAISVAVISCQKDKETENENQTLVKSSNDDSRELLNRIYAFQNLRDDINSGAKSGESMTLEELRDNIDLTFNFEHSQHATPFDYATLDTFYVKMPKVDANGNVTAAEAVATYNAFESELESLMTNVEDDSNHVKSFSIKFPEAGAKDGNDIEVVFTRGTEGGVYPHDGGPFTKGDDFIWGLMLGHCDPSQNTGRITDAANELTRKFQTSDNSFNLISNVEYAGYKPYDENGWFLPNCIYYEDTTMTCGHSWLFCYPGDCEEESCIPHNEMNCYWRNIMRNIVSPNGALHYGPKTNYPYHSCIVHDEILFRYEAKRDVRIHYVIVEYCNEIIIDNE